MQAILAETRNTIQEYIDDSQQNMMILSTTNEGPVLFLKALDGIEEDPRCFDIFLKFGCDFKDRTQFLNEVISSLESHINLVNQQLTSKEKQLTPLPETITSSTGSLDRLFDAMVHVRGVVPRDRKIVWLLFPLEFIGNESEYAALMEQLKSRIDEARLPASKLIVRETPSRLLSRQYNNNESVKIYFPFLDLESIRGRVSQQSNDPNVPAEEQAQAHMLLAGFDVAEGKFDQALQRNNELLGYFCYTKDRNRQSIVHNNIGDIHYLQGRFPEAQKSYEQALTISIEEKQQPLMIYQSINLANSLMMQLKFDEAIIYYSAAEKLAEANRALIHQVQAIERIGDCRRKQGFTDQAIDNWERCAEISRQHYYSQGLSSALERLVRVYDDVGLNVLRDERQTELKGLSTHSEPALAAAAGANPPVTRNAEMNP